MPDALETGLLTGTALPAGQRAFYEQKLLENLRTKSILVPFTVMKEDFAARDTGQITYTEVMDTEPNWNALSENSVWMKGAYLDSRSVTINMEIHGDVIKISDYNELVNYWNQGDLRGLVDGKLGQNMIETLDILARNAFFSHPNKTYAGGKASRAALTASDLFLPNLAELGRTHLEELEVPGVAATSDEEVKAIVCVTTPRVVHDMRTSAVGKWLEVHEYAGSGRIFTGEAGTWNGVRFIRTNRMRLRNAGAAIAQTTLDGATVPGQGAAATVDSIYNVGQAGSVRYVVVINAADFAVGKYVTIHSAALGTTVLEADGSQETRRIVDIDVLNKKLVFDKPLLKPHAAGDFVTNAIDIHGSMFLGGPGVVYGVGERPHPVLLPVIDDLGMIRRLAWRGFLKFQLFRPELFEIVESAGTTA